MASRQAFHFCKWEHKRDSRIAYARSALTLLLLQDGDHDYVIAKQGTINTLDGLRHAKLPLIEIWLVLGLLVLYAGVPTGVDSSLIWMCLLGQYGLLIASIWRPVVIYRGLPTFISTEFLFLFFSYLIFFYPYQLHVLGIYEVTESHYFPGHSFPEQSNHAIILALIATISFRAGVRALRSPVSLTTEAVRPPGRLDKVTVHALTIPVFALQSLLFISYEIEGWKASGEGRYTGSTAGGSVAEGIYAGITVLSMVAVALLILPSSKDEAPRSPVLWLSVFISGVWAARVLLAGDRNSFLLIAIVALAGLFTFRIRAGRWALAVLCVIALVLYDAIEQLRSGRIVSIFDFFLSEEAYNTASSHGDNSFNISTISVRAALACVPDVYDYGYGLYKLIGFAGVIPFIRGMVIPPDMAFTQSSDVLGAILLGPSTTSWVGSNIIVDIYMDFGLLSVPILLFGLGLGVAYAQRAVARGPASPWRAVFYLMTLALVAEIPRYTLAFPVRSLVWVLLLFWVVALLSPDKPQRSVSAQDAQHAGG